MGAGFPTAPASAGLRTHSQKTREQGSKAISGDLQACDVSLLLGRGGGSPRQMGCGAKCGCSAMQCSAVQRDAMLSWDAVQM